MVELHTRRIIYTMTEISFYLGVEVHKVGVSYQGDQTGYVVNYPISDRMV